MLIACNLAEEKDRTRLESAHTDEKIRNKLDEIGNPENLDSKSLIEMIDIATDLEQIEMKGISSYMVQFFKFIEGYDIAELPYIIHGLNKVSETLIDVCKKVDKATNSSRIFEKLSMVREMYGDIKVAVERTKKN